MRLYEAAIACRAYTAFGGEFDDSFRQFVAKTGGAVNLELDDCGSALMKWLNEWGCRQFAKEYHGDAIERIRVWARKYVGDLPGETGGETGDGRNVSVTFSQWTKPSGSKGN